MNAVIIDNELVDAILEPIDVDQGHHVRRIWAVAIFADSCITEFLRER